MLCFMQSHILKIPGSLMYFWMHCTIQFFKEYPEYQSILCLFSLLLLLFLIYFFSPRTRQFHAWYCPCDSASTSEEIDKCPVTASGHAGIGQLLFGFYYHGTVSRDVDGVFMWVSLSIFLCIRLILYFPQCDLVFVCLFVCCNLFSFCI